MFCNIKVSKDYFDDKLSKCPFCEHESDEVVNDSDYGIKAMIWCEKCGAEAFLDYNIGGDIPDKYLIPVQGESEYKEYNVPVLKILRTTGDTFIKMNQPLTDDEIREIFNGLAYDRGRMIVSPELTDKYNIQNLTYLSDEEYFEGKYDNLLDERYIQEHGFPHLLSLPVNSYDLNKPEIEYPKNFGLSHDGCYVWVLLENGETVYMSGD